MKVTAVILYILLSMQWLCTNAQPLPGSAFKLKDSLQNLLGYFYENTNDASLRQSIEKAKSLLAKDDISDSSASLLIAAETRMLELTEDSGILNRYPFKPDARVSFASLLASLFRILPPEKQNIWYAAALNNLGTLYKSEWLHNKADILQATQLFETSGTIIKKILGENSAEYAGCLENIAVIYQLKDENEKAKALMLHAMKIRKKSGGESTRAYAVSLYYLANLYGVLKQYDSSILLYDLMAATWKKADKEANSHYALWLYNTGEMMGYLWQYQKAFNYYQQALSITAKTVGKNNLQYAYCLEGIAGYYYIVAEYEKAIPLYLQSLTIKKSLYGKEYYDLGLTFHNLATTYFKMGRYEQALPYLESVLLLQQKDSGIRAYELSWQGSLYQSIGNYDKALSLYKQAIAISDYRKAKSRYAATLNSIASIYTVRNENKQALAYLEASGKIIKNTLGEQSPDYATNLYSSSVMYEKLSRYKKALDLCRQSMLIRKKLYGETHPQYALCLCELGSLYMHLNKTDSAEYCLTNALSIQQRVLGEQHPDYIKTLNRLSMLDMQLNHYSDAAALLIQSNKLELKHIYSTYTSLSEKEKIEFETDEYYQFSYLPSLLYKTHTQQPEVLQQVYNNELALKGMVLNDQQGLLNSIRKSNDTAALHLYNEWRTNKIFIGKQLLQPVQERPHSLDSIREITNRQEQQLSRISNAFRQQHGALTTKTITSKLQPGEAAIEFTRFQYFNKKWTDSILYAALLLLPGDSIPKFIPLFEEKQLASLLAYFINSEKSINSFFSAVLNNNNPFPARGDSLYKLVWKPLEKELTGIRTIHYAPAGLLHRLAIAALPYDKSNNRLINKYDLVQLFSTRSVTASLTTRQKPSGIEIWGNIQYTIPSGAGSYVTTSTARGLNGNISNNIHRTRTDTTISLTAQWPALPGSKIETDSIKNIFTRSGLNVVTLSDTGATEKNFKALDGRSPQIWHIATHGFFWPVKHTSTNTFTVQEDPMFRSGLILAGANNAHRKSDLEYDDEDGILTAYEIAQMDLSNTNLVVLSACETALGDLQNNEGVIGLQRAFKLAGVKQIIISLWRVPDTQTAELMSLFYSNWLEGSSAREALRSAQLIMQTKYPPYNWAGFVLVE